MNNKGLNTTLGFSILIVGFILIITAFATIEPFKESLDDVRGNSALNCPGTPDYNSTAYEEQTDFEKLVKRPTCFITGITLVYFIGSVLIGIVAWIGSSWRRFK